MGTAMAAMALAANRSPLLAGDLRTLCTPIQ
jgi:hypothetical protein